MPPRFSAVIGRVEKPALIGPRWLTIHITVLSGMFGLLGISFIHAVTISLLITIQSAAGLIALNRVTPLVHGGSLLLGGPGFVVGTVLWVLPTQIVGGGRAAAWFVLGSLCIITLWHLRNMGVTLGGGTNTEINSYLLAVGLALVVMSREWPYMALTGVGLATAFLLLGKRGPASFLKQSAAVAATVGGLLLLYMGIQRHGSYWWLVTDDYSYYAALQFHLARFGVAEPWGPTDIYLYHWLTPAWTGQLTHILNVDTWLILGRVAPFIFSLSLAATVIALANHFLRARKAKTLAVAVQLLAVTSLAWLLIIVRIDFSGTSTYAVFAYLATGLLILEYLRERALNFAKWLVIVSFSTLVIAFTKVFAVVAFVACLIPQIPIGALKKNLFRQLVLSATFVVVLLLLLPIVGKLLSGGWEFRRSIDWISLRGPVLLEAHRLLPIGVAALCYGYLARTQVSDQLRSLSSLLLLSLAISINLVIIPTFAIDIVNYLATPALFAAALSPLIAMNLWRDRWSDGKRYEMVISSVLGFAVALVSFSYFAETATFLSYLAQLVDSGSATQAAWIVAAVCLLLATAFTFLSRVFGGAISMTRMIWLALFLLFGLVVSGVSVARTIEGFSRNTQLWSNRESSLALTQLGHPDLVAIGEWISLHTLGSSVVATNDLCDSDQRTTADMSSTIVDHGCEFGTDYTLGHSAERKFFVLGPRFAYQDEAETAQRVSLSLEFATGFTKSVRERLEAAGVTHFVYFGSETLRGKVPKDAVVFNRGNYSVIDLHTLGLFSDPDSIEH